jgi:succinylarginine dihydrolase
MIELVKVVDSGALSEGDVVIIEDEKGNVFPAQIKEVLNKGSIHEEIILSKRRNLYFITSMYIDQRSWVVNVKLIVGAKMFSISNTTERFPAW